ncbi:hypothetical protein BE04_41415 [Sorangium cellulosum]|uniref:Uncharacterized protein n=1 Tax=Sorangium cellulosum TaxID=56 RepID=A0A150PZB5_SORCE|nr:hypothetical protein BE04_41415 [Sorangium cellulosum]
MSSTRVFHLLSGSTDTPSSRGIRRSAAKPLSRCPSQTPSSLAAAVTLTRSMSPSPLTSISHMALMFWLAARPGTDTNRPCPHTGSFALASPNSSPPVSFATEDEPAGYATTLPWFS